ncbi:thiamine pyrophosphate-binding protein [Streptomyces sp. NBC_01537]|uniref:alpha-keto acid decarboxylase family protein n=1 Tax=Streptomyces sp. NBC_01537 TaxID=2903896 RepID=UPI0038661376
MTDASPSALTVARGVRTVSVAEYLARRLHEAGIDHLFGVPGDFNLTLLDGIAETGLLKWIGSPNELGAGYAADAYARRRGLAALVTTYGVGELSCLNAVAGSAAENVPVLQITGAPRTTAAAARALVHHTLADGDFSRFERAFAEVTVAQEVLTPEHAAAQIDAVIGTVVAAKKPGYLSIPADLADARIDAEPLRTPLLPARADAFDTAAFEGAARRLLATAQRPVMVVGHIAARFRLAPGITALAEAGAIPVVVLPSAKGHIDETHPLYAGVYAGTLIDQATADLVESADAVIHLGVVMSDVLSGLFTHRPFDAVSIKVDAEEAGVGDETFGLIPFPEALRALRRAVDGTSTTLARSFARKPDVPLSPVAGAPLDQAGFWSAMQRWLPAGTTLLADIGTSYWGALSLTLPPGTELVGQPIWNSIGYALPATLGQGLADRTRRPVLVTGDGAAQMTIQEIGTIAAQGLSPVMILLNNAGYTIERAIQSPDAPYNDIAPWDWCALVTALTAGSASTFRVGTPAELEEALAAAESQPATLTFIDVVLDRHDAPPLLRALTERS